MLLVCSFLFCLLILLLVVLVILWNNNNCFQLFSCDSLSLSAFVRTEAFLLVVEPVLAVQLSVIIVLCVAVCQNPEHTRTPAGVDRLVVEVLAITLKGALVSGGKRRCGVDSCASATKKNGPVCLLFKS